MRLQVIVPIIAMCFHLLLAPSVSVRSGESPSESTQDLKGMANKGSHVSFAQMQVRMHLD